VSPATPPNVVFILADDLGFGDIGCFNGGASRTPTLDWLVEQGTVLPQHYSASPVCAPARASFLTGRYPHRTGAVDTLEGRGLDRIALGERTVADLLTSAGYTTGLVGKWHNGALDRRYHPTKRGFSEFAGFSGGWSDYWHWRLDRNGQLVESDGRYLTDVLTDEAIDFIRRHRREPFFLHLAYSAPHFPLQAPDADVDVFASTGRFTDAVSRIYAMVAAMDRGIGRLLVALDDEGLAEDTLVVFSSDNGPQFSGEGESSTVRFNCGYRGAKLLVYEGGIRLPAMVRWPAGLPALGSVDGLVHLTDWLPTLLAVAGAAPPRGLTLDGVDVLPLLRGDPTETPPTRFWQWNRYEPVGSSNAAMRDGDWKLVRPAIAKTMEVAPADLAMDIELKYQPGRHTNIEAGPTPEREVGAPLPVELFDLANDPGEEHDLARTETARVARMEAELSRWFEDAYGDYLLAIGSR
jgi:arylsulfatase A